MFQQYSLSKKILTALLFLSLSTFFGFNVAEAGILSINQTDSLISISGVVLGENGEKLPYAAISVEKSNLSTVTNAEGEFLLKIPASFVQRNILISYLGYENLKIPVTSLQNQGNKLRLQSAPLSLPALEVISKDPDMVIRTMMDNRLKNYSSKEMLMTAFYRETIKKRNTNVSLAEAIAEVCKRAYNSNQSDMVSLFKSRKSTNYHKLDTLVFKLMGGPFNNIYLDVMRYPDIVFTDKIFDNYQFTFLKTDRIEDRLMYVISFKQLPHVVSPLYYGNLYIDAETYALAKADFNMNLENNEEATQMFVKKKPFNAKVSTTKAHFVVDYRLIGDKWFYSYSRVDLNMKIDWRKKLFNTYYNSNIEMAATDWTENFDPKIFKTKDKISSNVIIQDEASGFADSQFWGEYNIIEPDKSIENAINKIIKQLRKNK